MLHECCCVARVLLCLYVLCCKEAVKVFQFLDVARMLEFLCCIISAVMPACPAVFVGVRLMCLLQCCS